MTDRGSQSGPRRVWIDTDPAILSGNGEVDDGYALLLALRSPEIDVVGVSAVFGNTTIENTFSMTKDILVRTGCGEIPVYRGHAIAGARGANEATEALSKALDDGVLTIVALGPLTNIAAALNQPDVKLSRVDEVVFVGGRRTGLVFRATPEQETPFQDLNFELDVEAAAELLSLGVPITLAGWEVSSEMWLLQSHLETMMRDGDASVKWLADASQAWLDIWVKDFKAPGFTPFDTLAVGWLLRPGLFEVYEWPADITYSSEGALFRTDPSIDGPNVTYLKSVDNEEFRKDLMARLL